MALLDIERPPRSGTEGALAAWVRALEATAPIAASPQRLLPHAVAEMALHRGKAPALLSAHETLTYAALSERANRYARWALSENIAKDETVCLMMPNRPEYMAIWLGITSIGAVVSLINTQLRGPSLAHCIDLVAPEHVIVAGEVSGQLRAAPIASRPKIWLHGDGGDRDAEITRLDRAVEQFSEAPLTRAERRPVTIADRALTIYTSGTTGLPKAANVSHRRLLQWSYWFAGLMDVSADDRMYDCLPMYHAIGGVVATGSLLVRGGSVVIRDKFSAREFWDDVAESGCTLFQYIGELGRYLVNAPAHPRERAHRLRLAAGNGMQSGIWEEFKARFAIPKILEFYAATEANVSLYNVEGKIGAIGRVPPFLAHRFPLALVKFDAATGLPARDRNERCIRCAVNEPGEAIGAIRTGAHEAGGAFEGYTSAEDTERKILRDVFEPGDAWFRTGDLMRKDAAGFFYFIDRTGDTFRWKGENVATSEVAAALMSFAGIAEASVYGVSVPHHEGSAGMAAIVAAGALDLAALRAHLMARLPSYARPLFLRIQDRIEVTGTYKYKTAELKAQGFNPAATPEPIFFDHPERQIYVRLDAALYADIGGGGIRL